MKALLIVLGMLSFFVSGWAEEPACFRDLATNFFRTDYVLEALAGHDEISQSTWNPINKEIQNQAHDVPKLVRERAQKMNPNPFHTPFQKKDAEIVFKDTLYQVLAQALEQFNVTNPSVIREVLEHVRERNSRKWKECFGEEGEALKK